MRIVYQAESVIDAQLVHDALAEAGIPAHVSGGYLTGALGELPALGLVSVLVPDAHHDQALGIAAEVDRDLAAARAEHAGDEGEDLLPAR